MGVIAAALGMALASADQGAATNVAFYAANHVLVKAALFLTVGAVAALDGRARTLALIVAALLGLSLAGLPLTGGALAKLAVKDLFGDGAAGVASQLSAAATTALMLVFVMRLARSPAAERVGAPSGRLWSWAALAVAALLIPWLMFAAIGSPAEALEPAKLSDAVWPMLIGAALAAGSMGRWGSASPHSRRRHRRRRGGRVPGLTLSRAPRSSGPTAACGSGRRRASRCSWSRSPSPRRDTRAGKAPPLAGRTGRPSIPATRAHRRSQDRDRSCEHAWWDLAAGLLRRKLDDTVSVPGYEIKTRRCDRADGTSGPLQAK